VYDRKEAEELLLLDEQAVEHHSRRGFDLCHWMTCTLLKYMQHWRHSLQLPKA